jgi:hypothetical protein
VAGLLDRLDARQAPEPATERRVEQQIRNPELLLLDWLMNRWTKSSVTLRDIQAFGPGSIRNKDVALNLMQILGARGWITPVRPHRYDMK